MSTPARLPAPQLTPRELEVLSYLPRHQSSREIAAETFISVNTVRSHVKSIYLKLGVTNRRDAIRSARQLGLLPAAEQHAAEASEQVRSLSLAPERDEVAAMR